MTTINIKHLIISLLALLSLASCSEQEISRETPGGIAGNSLRLSVRLGNGAATRALGDPFASASDEKRIDRLAFFVHTAEDGLQVYPPVPDNVTDPTVAAADYPNHVYLAETSAGSRQYTADVTLTAGGGYMADVVAVANLPKDYDYNQIVTWDGLQDSVTVWADEMPACTPGTGIDDPARRAFVMYGYTRTELVKEEVNAFALALERLAARIDITNEAYVKGMTAADPKGGFLLTSVRLLRACPTSYITPQPGYASPDVATINDWLVTDIPYGKATALDATANPTREPDAVEASAAETDATLQYLWRTLYTYENSDTEHAPTALEIKGNFRGTEVTRRIDFINADKQPVALVRNHRYLVRILPAPGQTDITFDIKVSEWDAVDTVNVKPDQTEVPVITGVDGNGVYVEKTKRFDAYYSADGEISFDAACSFAPDVRVRYEEPEQTDWITVEKSEPELVTKASKFYKRHFKITILKTTDKMNRKAMLLIHNGGSEVECDTIFVRQTYYYPGTDLEPVALGESNGKDIIWAPVNVGAVRLPTKDYTAYSNALNSEELQSQIEEMGYCFQWGRRLGIQPTTETPFSLGPISKEELLHKHEMKNEFVAVHIGTIDWITPPDNELWRGDGIKGTYDPCPEGWRVPNKTELQVLEDKIMNDGLYDKEKGVFNISGSQLILPTTPYFFYVGYITFIGVNEVILWSSTAIDDISSYWLRFSNGKSSSGKQYKAGACPVRCIQE